MHEVITVRAAPALRAVIQGFHVEAWPEFLAHDAGVSRRWGSIYDVFPEHQFVLRDAAGATVAAGNAVPVGWDGTLSDLPDGIAAVLERALGGRPATVLCALAAMVTPAHRGAGLSRAVVEAMRAYAVAAGLRAVIAPVRPPGKARYPLTSMARYARWARPDGAPVDDWLRVHWRLGAAVLAIAPEAMVVEGSVAEWEAWTGMAFPDSGDYVVPGALQPVTIDRERDGGRYCDPNVWMEHRVGGAD
jgi:GNAT superfamily N-acetyltransferase